MFAPKMILVATDFSEYSNRALNAALDIAKMCKAKIIMLHVIDEHIEQCFDDYCFSEEAFAELQSKSAISSKEKMQEAIREISPKGKVVSFSVRNGVPYLEILQEQKKSGADLIVLGSHGKRGFVQNILGGVTDKVSRGAMVPVLIVR